MCVCVCVCVCVVCIEVYAEGGEEAPLVEECNASVTGASAESVCVCVKSKYLVRLCLSWFVVYYVVVVFVGSFLAWF